ncbi:hypothetical protein AGMMS49928_22040 [Spirochaetia bacterium]|nr:hypothetical protein AGMMS49928_22040 [Spirochaetia bacterium]
MPDTLNIIPLPQSVKMGEGFFNCKGIPPVKGDGIFSREIDVFRQQLEACGIPAWIPAGQGAETGIVCRKVETLKDEAYRLKIAREKIILEASSGAGMYHGLQSLRQLFLSGGEGGGKTEGGFALPCADVEDYPRFPWRGLMLDCSRNFYSKNFVKKIIDAISLHHLSIFHWHLTDDQGWRFPVDAYPLLTEIGSKRYDKRRWRYTGGFYTKDDIREVVAYAAARHVEVVPEVDFPGHASSILAPYPGLGCTGGPYGVEDRFGIFEDVLCAGNDAIFDLIEKVFDTLAELFPSKWVHIGGDEVLYNRWNECPKCRKRMEETGLKNSRELQSWITVKLVQMLGERGKTAIGWDEILEDTPAYKLPPQAAVMSWRGRKGGAEAAERGHSVVMSPNTDGCYLDYQPVNDPDEPGQLGTSGIKQLYNMNAVDAGMSAEEASRIIGGQANLWTELVYAARIAEYMIFPRICALAETVWTEKKDFDDFARRLPLHQARLDKLDLIQYRGPLA